MAATQLNIMYATSVPRNIATELAVNLARETSGLAIYSAGLIGMFAASAACNCVARTKELLRLNRSRHDFRKIAWHGLVLPGATCTELPLSTIS